MKKPKIVVLCGSSKFVDIMAVCVWLIERDEGAIALGPHLIPWWYSEEEIPDHLAEHEGVSEAMEELHLRKIDIADEVFIVNHKGYMGESTSKEIEYARSLGKTLRWYTCDNVGDKVRALIDQAALREGEAHLSHLLT